MSQASVKSVFDAVQNFTEAGDLAQARETVLTFLQQQERTFNNNQRATNQKHTEIFWYPEVNELCVYAATTLADKLRDLRLIASVVQTLRIVYVTLRDDQVRRCVVRMFNYMHQGLDAAADELAEAGILDSTDIDQGAITSNPIIDAVYGQPSEHQNTIDAARFWWEACTTVIKKVWFNTPATHGAYIHCCNRLIEFCIEHQRPAELAGLFESVARSSVLAALYRRRPGTAAPVEDVSVVRYQLNLRIDFLAAAVKLGAWQTGLSAVENIVSLVQEDPAALMASSHYICALGNAVKLFHHAGHHLYNALALFALFQAKRTVAPASVHRDFEIDPSAAPAAAAGALSGAATPMPGTAVASIAGADFSAMDYSTQAVHDHESTTVHDIANLLVLAAAAVPVDAPTHRSAKIDDFFIYCGVPRAMIDRTGLTNALGSDRMLALYADAPVVSLLSTIQKPVSAFPAPAALAAIVDAAFAAAGDAACDYTSGVKTACAAYALMHVQQHTAKATTGELINQLSGLCTSEAEVIACLVRAARARLYSARYSPATKTVQFRTASSTVSAATLAGLALPALPATVTAAARAAAQKAAAETRKAADRDAEERINARAKREAEAKAKAEAEAEERRQKAEAERTAALEAAQKAKLRKEAETEFRALLALLVTTMRYRHRQGADAVEAATEEIIREAEDKQGVKERANRIYRETIMSIISRRAEVQRAAIDDYDVQMRLEVQHMRERLIVDGVSVAEAERQRLADEYQQRAAKVAATRERAVEELAAPAMQSAAGFIFAFLEKTGMPETILEAKAQAQAEADAVVADRVARIAQYREQKLAEMQRVIDAKKAEAKREKDKQDKVKAQAAQEEAKQAAWKANVGAPTPAAKPTPAATAAEPKRTIGAAVPAPVPSTIGGKRVFGAAAVNAAVAEAAPATAAPAAAAAPATGTKRTFGVASATSGAPKRVFGKKD